METGNRSRHKSLSVSVLVCSCSAGVALDSKQGSNSCNSLLSDQLFVSFHIWTLCDSDNIESRNNFMPLYTGVFFIALIVPLRHYGVWECFVICVYVWMFIITSGSSAFNVILCWNSNGSGFFLHSVKALTTKDCDWLFIISCFCGGHVTGWVQRHHTLTNAHTRNAVA